MVVSVPSHLSLWNSAEEALRLADDHKTAERRKPCPLLVAIYTKLYACTSCTGTLKEHVWNVLAGWRSQTY